MRAFSSAEAPRSRWPKAFCAARYSSVFLLNSSVSFFMSELPVEPDRMEFRSFDSRAKSLPFDPLPLEYDSAESLDWALTLPPEPSGESAGLESDGAPSSFLEPPGLPRVPVDPGAFWIGAGFLPKRVSFLG